MTRYLLDTHVLIAAMQAPERLPGHVRTALSDASAERWISVVSAIEIAVKASIGKLPLPPAFERNFQTAYEDSVVGLAADSLGLQITHAARVRDLPLHHRDPFDRLLIAQALEEDLVLVSGDRMFERYAGLKVLAA